MSSYALICNPVSVWDFRGYFASNPEYGYWCVTKTVFNSAKAGDRLYLRVTSADAQPGIHGRFLVDRKEVAEVDNRFWREDKHPDGVDRVIWFRNENYGILTKPLSVATLRSLLPSTSRMLNVPQARATEIPDSEADILDAAIFMP